MSRPLRIVQAAAFPFPSPQGSQVFVRGMARALARRGHAVTVACYAHGEGEPDGEYAVVRTPRLPGYNNLRAGPDLVKPGLDVALAAKIAGIPADIVHAHNYEAPLAAVIARRRTRVPVVYGAHNTMSEELHTYFEGRTARRVAHGPDPRLRSVLRRHDRALQLAAPSQRRLPPVGHRRGWHGPQAAHRRRASRLQRVLAARRRHRLPVHSELQVKVTHILKRCGKNTLWEII